MYRHTHNGIARIEWPDGGSYLNQLQLLVQIWEVITNEMRKAQDDV